MTNLVQSSQLSQYSQHQFDRTYADRYETLLGHLVCERGKDLKAAIEDLRPTVKQAHRQTIASRDICQKIGLAGIAIGVLIGASPLGIGLSLPPLLAGSLALKFWGDSRSELPRRLAEYHLLKTAPNLPEAIWGLSLRGANPTVLIGAYDQLVSAIEARLEDGRDFSEAEVGEFLQAKIQSSLSGQDFQPLDDQGVKQTQSLPTTELQPLAAQPSLSHITAPVWNPATDLGENPQSSLIVGTPGSGKGMMISNAVRVLKTKHPDLKVFVIDPKADPKEFGYWQSIADTYRAFCLMDCPDPDAGAEWLLGCMDEFRTMPGPKLLIFDELMAASTELSLADPKIKALKRLKKFIVGLIGQGDSRSVWIWAMTQSPQVEDLGISGGARANLRVIGLVAPKNITAVEALTSTRLIPPPPGGMDELRQIMQASPCSRAVFDGKVGLWLPMPVLENYSGFDRDNRNASAEKPTRRLEEVFGEDFFKDHPQLTHNPSEVEVEASIINDRPDGLEDFPLVLAVWEYLDGKEPRTIKQITMALRKSNKVTEEELRNKLGMIESYSSGITNIVNWGVSNGFLKANSDDSFSTLTNKN